MNPVEKIFDLDDGVSLAVRVDGITVSATVLTAYHHERRASASVKCKSYDVVVDPQDGGRVYFSNAFLRARPSQVDAIASFVRETARTA